MSIGYEKDIFALLLYGFELLHLNHGEAVDVICRKAVCNQCVSIACNQANGEQTYTLSRDAIPRYARITYAPAVQLHTKLLAWIKSTSFCRSLSIFGLPERIRTVDLQSRSLTRYPAVPRVDIRLLCKCAEYVLNTNSLWIL